jgi:hypothetical protein
MVGVNERRAGTALQSYKVTITGLWFAPGAQDGLGKTGRFIVCALLKLLSRSCWSIHTGQGRVSPWSVARCRLMDRWQWFVDRDGTFGLMRQEVESAIDE